MSDPQVIDPHGLLASGEPLAPEGELASAAATSSQATWHFAQRLALDAARGPCATWCGSRDVQVLRDHINPVIGPTRLPDVTLEDAERVMARLPSTLERYAKDIDLLPLGKTFQSFGKIDL
jgi:hypothetical protein